MAGADTETWTHVLDELTKKAAQNGLLATVAKAKGFDGKIRAAEVGPGVRSRLTKWISHCTESNYLKQGSMATRLREEGNKKYASHDCAGALNLYTQSLICSPQYGPELGYAYGNRSVALYALGHFRHCLEDIDLALRHRFPQKSEFKLHQRRGQCLTKLGQYDEARRAFQRASETLEVAKLDPKKYKARTKEIRTLITEIEKLAESGVRPSSVPAAADDRQPGQPAHGLNADFPSASNGLELRFSSGKERHVVARRDLLVGDILFSEEPYASVLLPEHFATHCNHCITPLHLAPVPCLQCTQPRYCSKDCRDQAWKEYHSLECMGLDLLHSVGISHLALRLVLVCGMDKLLANRATLNQKHSQPVQSSDPHTNVIRLVDHLDERPPEDIFQYTITALLLAMYLEQRTKFFEPPQVEAPGLGAAATGAGVPKRDPELVANLNQLSLSDAALRPSKEDLFLFVGAVLLKHSAQLVCNASAIYDVGPTNGSEAGGEGSNTQEIAQFHLGSAIYPSVSMMNHACRPSVINSFYKRRIIVRAIADVKAGGEVFNSYGPHFSRHSAYYRRRSLLSQYNFECKCDDCVDRETIARNGRFLGHHLRCESCSGPVMDPLVCKKETRLPCLTCHSEQDVLQRKEQLLKSETLVYAAARAVQAGDIDQAIQYTLECYNTRKELLYEHSETLVGHINDLAYFYSVKGDFRKSAAYIKITLGSIEKRFGPNSIELGHELKKYTEVVLTYLKGCDGQGQKQEQAAQLALELKDVAERCLGIFRLHYGQWHKATQEVKKLLEVLL